MYRDSWSCCWKYSQLHRPTDCTFHYLTLTLAAHVITVMHQRMKHFCNAVTATEDNMLNKTQLYQPQLETYVTVNSIKCNRNDAIERCCINVLVTRFPRLLQFFSLEIPWPGKSWEINLVVESPAKYPWKSCIFSASNGKQAAIV